MPNPNPLAGHRCHLTPQIVNVTITCSYCHRPILILSQVVFPEFNLIDPVIRVIYAYHVPVLFEIYTNRPNNPIHQEPPANLPRRPENASTSSA